RFDSVLYSSGSVSRLRRGAPGAAGGAGFLARASAARRENTETPRGSPLPGAKPYIPPPPLAPSPLPPGVCLRVQKVQPPGSGLPWYVIAPLRGTRRGPRSQPADSETRRTHRQAERAAWCQVCIRKPCGRKVREGGSEQRVGG